MHFLKIEIEEFGKLADFTLELGEGVNLVEGKNESGKSTLLAFLRFVLYNFPRRNAEGGDERDKRLSWRNRRAAGSLTLSHGGETYRITRSFSVRGSGSRETPVESHAVVRLSDGQKISLDGKTPGEYFLGLPAELYDSSLCLSQSDASRVASPAVREAVGDLLFSGESTLCAEDAEGKLQAARRDLQHIKGRGGRIAALEDELARLDAALAKAGEDAAALAALRTKGRALHATLDAQRTELSEVNAAIECLGIEQTLSLFEAHRNAAAEEAAARERLEEAKERLAALPDASIALRVEEAIRAVEAARAEVARKAPEVARLETVRHDERLLNAAAEVEKAGGAPMLLAKHEKLCHSARRCGVFSIILLLLAALMALPLILVPQFALYCIAAAALLALCSLSLLFALLGKRRKTKRLLAGIAATNTTMLRTYLQQCQRERDSHEAHNALLAALRSELDAAKESEQGAAARLQAEFAMLSPDAEALTAEEARALLRELNEKQSAARVAVDTARLAVGKASGVREALEGRLSGADESALLARREALPRPTVGAERLQERKAALQDAVRECERLCLDTDRAESARAATANDTEALARERAAVEAELAAARRRLAAIGMAITALSEATEDLRRGITPRLREDASRIFSELTEGAYEGLVLGNDFSISLPVGGEPLPLSRFSAGCRDAAHLSLRLALLKTLSDERLPLLFDEAFSRLDDERARALLSILQAYANAGGQVLLFTCHSRERVMLSDDLTVKSVTLS